MSEEVAEKRCPKCGAHNLTVELPQREYRCGHCGLELAHLDTNVHGAIRGVLGWILDVGTEINGRYRVTTVLGKGGFGVTYLVDDMRLHGKRRALKEIPEVLFDEHETRLLGRLSHPAVPDITDRFADSGMVYLVLEFGGNRTLRIEQERRGGRIPVFVLLPWVRQLCDALQYLHAQDPPVVHRDLKPDNILLDDNERIMLIDFGIAKEAAPNTATRTLGRAASHGFSPPEQVLGTGTDARSDVYALGAIVYNLLTNRMPEAAHERITGATIEPLSRILPEIPALIEAAVMKALELNINLRQQSIAELAKVFDLVQSGTDSAATVCVAGVAGTQAPPSTGDEIILPSVQLPSAPASPTATTLSRVRIAQPGVAPTPVPAKRSRAGLVALAVAFIAVAGGGYWYLEKEGLVPRIAGEQEAKDGPTDGIEPAPAEPTAEGAGVAETAAAAGSAGSEAVETGKSPVPDAGQTAQAQDGNAIAPEPVDVPPADAGAGAPALVEEPPVPVSAAVQGKQAQDGGAGAPAPVDLPADEATGIAEDAPTQIVPSLATEQAAPEAGQAPQVQDGAPDTSAQVDAPAVGVAEHSAAASDSKGAAAAAGVAAGTAAAVASRRGAASSGLPSIYSSEQKAANAPGRQDSGESLLDVFKKHRGGSIAEPPVATVAPRPAKVAPKKSKTTTTTKKKTRKTVKKKRKSAPSSAAAWGFKYKGAEKK